MLIRKDGTTVSVIDYCYVTPEAVSFELKGDLNRTIRFVDNLKLALIGASLGGTETLVSQPSTVSHFFMDPVERRKAGISDSLVRLSLGIEDADDIVSDLAQALEA